MKVTEDFVISSANSAGIIDLPRSWHNLARPGIILYGPQPSDVMTNTLPLEYVMSLVSHVTHVQTLHKGEAIGYGGTYVADHDMKTATIPIGYADGYPASSLIRGSSHRRETPPHRGPHLHGSVHGRSGRHRRARR